MKIAEGEDVELPVGIHGKLDNKINPTRSTVWFKPSLTGKGVFDGINSMMNSLGGRGKLCRCMVREYRKNLITLVSIFRISACMYNVDESKTFRPFFGIHLELVTNKLLTIEHARTTDSHMR